MWVVWGVTNSCNSFNQWMKQLRVINVSEIAILGWETHIHHKMYGKDIPFWLRSWRPAGTWQLISNGIRSLGLAYNFIFSFTGCIYKKVSSISLQQDNTGFENNEKSFLEISSITYPIFCVLQIKFEHISKRKKTKPMGITYLSKVSSG